MSQYPKIKRLALLWSVLFTALLVQAQAPAGYYSAARGKKGAAVKTALYTIVSTHTQRSYNQLWTDFKSTDTREDGKIRDRYSNVTAYTPGGGRQGASYKGEGDSYNREHSFPKSWFDEAYPMYTDLFHLYPTDGYVNGRRSNYPFGENRGERYTSSGGYSKLGACTVSGYSGICFEPNDEYKGDFARTYFYMATAYEDKIASWNSPMLSGNKYPAYANWALAMLLRWAKEDPVSQVEIDRNNAVYRIQKNRNPYIDFPGLEQYVWGAYTAYAFDPDNYEANPSGGTEPQPGGVAAPVFSPEGGKVESGATVTISCATAGASIAYSVNGAAYTTAPQPVRLTITKAASVTAYAVLGDGRESGKVTASYTIKDTPAVPEGENVYVLVTDESELAAGGRVLIVCPDKGVAMAAEKQDIRDFAEVTVDAATQSVTTETGGEGQPVAFELGGNPQGRTFKDCTDGSYLALTAKKNKLHSSDEDNGSEQERWTVTISADGAARIANCAFGSYFIQYNAGAPRFACYTNAQTPVAIYRCTGGTTGVERVAAPAPAGGGVVYDLLGRPVSKGVSARDALRSLPAGVYIHCGRKVVVK